jgi:carboxyl-terminal processing protease
LRFNPGGRLEQAINIVNMFVKKGAVILTTKGRARDQQVYTANGEGTLPNFPMIVMVNELSASAAEIVSGSLKDNQRATIVGTRSYGKGSVQEVMNLDQNGGELKLTVAYYYLPSGRLVHRKPGATDWGVEPQIIVPMDDKGENVIREAMAEKDIIHRPPSTQPTTAADASATDGQLKQAEATMIGLMVLDKGVPTTGPSTMPVQ